MFTLRAINGARTRDPQLGKLVLYQLSYYREGLLISWQLKECGADTRTRTGDPRITNALLYQLSHIGLTELLKAAFLNSDAKVMYFSFYAKSYAYNFLPKLIFAVFLSMPFAFALTKDAPIPYYINRA